MNENYTQAMLMSDIMSTIQANAEVVIYAAIFIACVNFVIGWFMYGLEKIAKAGRA